MELTLAFKIIGIHFFLLKEVQPEPDKAMPLMPAQWSSRLASSTMQALRQLELQRPNYRDRLKTQNKNPQTNTTKQEKEKNLAKKEIPTNY